MIDVDLKDCRSISISKSSLSVIDAGKGKTVVLAHSFLWDAWMWREQLTDLAHHYRIIAPDLWGHGGSGRLPRTTIDLKALAFDHLALLDRLGIERFTLVGHSIGGMWAAELALAVPERVEKLVLMNTSLGPEPEASRQRYLQFLAAVAASEKVPDALLDAVVPLFFAPDIERTKPELPARLRSALSAWSSQSLIESVVPLGRIIFDRIDRRNELALLRMPTLIVSGSMDRARPPQESREMANIIGCHHIEIPDAGHLAPLESPDRITRVLLDFLASAP